VNTNAPCLGLFGHFPFVPPYKEGRVPYHPRPSPTRHKFGPRYGTHETFLKAHEEGLQKQRIRKRGYRLERIATGMCTECGKRPARPHVRACEPCARQQGDRVKSTRVSRRKEEL
jgi:hypothetical protein